MSRLGCHIALVCLLTVLGISGTHGLNLAITYQEAEVNYGDLYGTQRSVVRFDRCKGGKDYVLSAFINNKRAQISFPLLEEVTDTNPILFRVYDKEHDNLCTVYYDPDEFHVNHGMSGEALMRQKTAVTKFGLIVHLREVREWESEEVLEVLESSEDYVALGLPIPISFEVELKYKVGSFPHSDCVGCFSRIFNRKWSFKPALEQPDSPLKFTCRRSQFVKLNCVDEEGCTEIKATTTDTASENVLAYIVKNSRDRFRLEKGNQKKFADKAVCTLHVDANLYEHQFPRNGFKKRVNVLRKDGSKSGFRIFMRLRF